MAYGLVKIKNNGVWNTLRDLYIKRNGTWQPVQSAWVKNNGVWKRVFPTPEAVISLSTNEINVTQYTDETSTTRVVITNNGEYKLEIRSITTTGSSQISVQVDSTGLGGQNVTTIEPGQSKHFDVRVTGVFGGASSSGSVTIKYDKGELTGIESTSIVVNATILQRFSTCVLSKSSIALSIVATSVLDNNITISNTGNGTLAIAAISVPNWAAVDASFPLLINPGNSTNITIRPIYSTVPGNYSGTLTVLSNAVNGTQTASISLRSVQQTGLVTLGGRGTWTVPDRVFQIAVSIAAGGGAGGHGSTFTPQQGGGGGGAGGNATQFLTVTPGQQFSYYVGAGGAAGPRTNAAGSAGGNTGFGDMLATGGQPGGRATRYSPGVGGAGGSPNGQNGQTGQLAYNPNFAFGGNGGANLFGNGGIGGGNNPGTGTTGAAGTGGGGGGAWQIKNTDQLHQNGAAGAPGIIRISY